MNIIPFENLKVTTKTMIITLSQPINTNLAFQLLPITKIDIEHKRQSSKCKLPHCKIPGSIISMGYKGVIRGVIKSKKPPFKNSVTIDMSITEKNINMKLSTKSIQICGARSRESGIEASTYLINYIVNIQDMINKIRQNREHVDKIVEWIKEHTKGELVERASWETIYSKDVNLNIYRGKKVPLYKSPEEPIPEEFDQNIAKMLISLTEGFMYHSDICQKLEYILEAPDITPEKPKIVNVNEAMVNYNYSLGFEVNRFKLNEFIKGYENFISRYNNALSNCVTIELPYTPAPNVTIKRRNNKIPHHTFLVYRSGSVTQSGPGGTIMKDAYYAFMNIIEDLKPFIEYNRDNDELTPPSLSSDATSPESSDYNNYDPNTSYIYNEMFG